MNNLTTLLVVSTAIMMSLVPYANAGTIRCVQNNNTIGLVGLDSSTSTVYASTKSVSNECSCSHVRFFKEKTDTKMALSILLLAKATNKKVRIDLLDENNCNTAYRAYIH